MSWTTLGSRNLGVTGNNLAHSCFNNVSIAVGDELVFAAFGYKRAADTLPIQAGSAAAVGGSEVWTEVASQLVTSDGNAMIWLGIYTSTALDAYGSGGTFEVDTTFPITTRFAAFLGRHSEPDILQQDIDVHNGVEPYNVSFVSPVSTPSTKIAIIGARKGASIDADADWVGWTGSGEGGAGNDFYGFHLNTDDTEATITVGYASVAGSVDAALYLMEFGTALAAGASLDLHVERIYPKPRPYELGRNLLR